MDRASWPAWPARAGGLGVAVATLGLLLATGPSLSIVWDEGYTLGREARVRAWFRALANPARFAADWRPPWPEMVQADAPDATIPAPRGDQLDTRAKLFSPSVLAWFWPFGREEPHGHPPFYALVGMVGDLLAPSWELLPRARLGPMLLFSLTAGALFAFAARRWGGAAAAVAAGAWALQPRLFAHGHYALYDAPLTCLWVGAILAFARAVEPRDPPGGGNPRWAWAAAFGVLCGLAADTKLTGWFLPLPFVAWTALYRDRRGAWTLALGAVVAVATLYAFNPPWWTDPAGGVARFLRSNLSRAHSTIIPTLFLGRVIVTPQESLPWYNTLAWTAFVTPVGFLGLALAGAVGTLRGPPRDRVAVLAVGHWAFLLALRALPHTPGHDGERLFLPAFGVLAVLAGLGAARLAGRWGRAAHVLVGASLLEGALSVALSMPVPLSYYSPAVGGLPGATALGMEATYYWDGVTPDALDRLGRLTKPGEKVLFAGFSTSWFYLHKTGRLRPSPSPRDPGAWAWYVVQNRGGMLREADRDLIARLGREHVLVEKWGVPLVWAFPFSELRTDLFLARPPPVEPAGSSAR